MSLNPDHVVISRRIYNGEYPIVMKLLKDLSSRENSEEGYYYIDIGKTKIKSIRQILVTRFAENIIYWLCDSFDISIKQAIYMEGAFPGLIFEYYITLYDLEIEGIKRYVCLTDEALINNMDPFLYPEVFCETLEQAQFYFSNVSGMDNIIDVYEEDDRNETI